MKRIATGAFLILFTAWAAVAQSPAPSPAPDQAASASAPTETPSPEPAEGELTGQTLPMDIATAGLHELAAWCRSLSLPETGALDELRGRLYAHYGVAPPRRDEGADRSIEIRAAREADYFTIEDGGDTMVRLRGGVVLVMTESKRSWTHEIRAREIAYNQSLSLLSARGDIEYKLSKPEGQEYFYGEALDVDLSTWTGTFLDGRVIRSTTGSGLEKKFTFSADVIEKGGGDVSVFSDAVISSCPDYERPHYSIRASKAWILGKSEWGLSNAVLSVGEVPVLYLPFFYYTGEEIAFHPVIGTKDREGYFANATVYLLGRKQASKESISLLQLNAQEGDNEKRLVGVYLLSTDRAAKGTTDLFKVMLDAYTNLGVMAGVEAAFSSNKALPTLNLSGVAALTRNVYQVTAADGTAAYSPFSPAHEWRSVWNSSNLFGSSIPLRFGVELGARYQPPKTGLSLGLQLPFYTDPYVEQDFDVRSEDMKWFSFLEEKKSAATSATGKRELLEMKAEASYAPDLGPLKPYLNSFNLSFLRTKLSSKSRKAYAIVDGSAADYEAVDPARDFFAPEQWTMADAALSLSGSIFAYPIPARPAAAGSPKEEAGAEPAPEPRSPWYGEEAEVKSDTGEEAGGETAAGNETEEGEFDLSASYRHAKLKIGEGSASASREPFSFSLGYEASPSAAFERTFASAPWRRSADVDWASLYDRRLMKLSGSLKANAALYGSLATIGASLGYSVQGQEHSGFNQDPALLSQTAINNRRILDYQALQDRLTATLSIGANPLQDIPMWSASSLSYKLDCLIRNRSYAGLDPSGGGPIYQTSEFGWNAQTITGHSLSLTVGAKPLGWSQSLTLSSSLPPLDPSYQATLSLKAWNGSLSATNRLYLNKADSTWKFDDLKTTASYAFMPGVSLSDTFAYNLNENHPASNSVSLALWDLSASLAHVWGKDLSLNSRVWQEVGEDGLQASSLTMRYSSSVKPIYLWKNRVTFKPALSSDVNLNFLRYTSSTFSFAPSLSLSVADFLDINFSSSSQNSKVYSYFVGLPGFETDMGLARRNAFADLADSFAFWDPDLRKGSNFKLKGIKVSAVHHLDDWDLTLSYEGKSERDGQTNSYVFNPYFTLNLAWKQIPEIKTEVGKTPTTFTLK